jgi:3-mercaptopyruvate sulfurtransferase SseA
MLTHAGKKEVLDLVGGFKAWTASKLPVEEGLAGARS